MTFTGYLKPSSAFASRFQSSSAVLYCLISLLTSGCNPAPDTGKIAPDTGQTTADGSKTAPDTGKTAVETGQTAATGGASVSKTAAHPLDPLTAAEIEASTQILKKSGKITDASRFASISLLEPEKSSILNFKPGDPNPRKSFSVIYEAAGNKTFEAIVDLTNKALVSYKQAAGQALVPEDVTTVRKVVYEDKTWQAAMSKRGIQNFADVYVSVWASAYLPETATDRNRMLKAIFFYRGPSDNAFFRPIEGVVADVDVTKKKIVKLSDSGVVPIAPVKKAIIPPSFSNRIKIQAQTKTAAAGNQSTDIADLEINGQEVHWKNWRFRFAVEPREGLVLYTVSYDDHGKMRSVLYRGSVSELCVPYADPTAGWSFRDAFDAGQYGLGNSISALEPLADAPANAKFFDAVIADQLGAPVVRPNSVAIYEKDGGILWRHFDRPNNRQLSVRGKDLVLSYITTLSNYDYCFNWIFHEDGSLDMETGMTGVMLAKGVANAISSSDLHAHAVEKTIEAVHHQHFFCFRLDMDVDGAANNSLIETNGISISDKSKNPYGNAFCITEQRLTREKDAARLINLDTTRRWKVVNDIKRNELGQNTGYMLIPGENSIPYSQETSFVRRKAGFINSHVWATAYDPAQMYAAGAYPFDSDGSKGLSDWVKANRSIEGKDIVLWYNLGITHMPRPEEWPIMPVHRGGFKLAPNCFFAKNPALDFVDDQP
ncbi:MAG: primary-amine oxidase [Candidatus Melainabacteria bacterium]|nr:MAG: primary-amine oxidase [Candidatus Melainabacteria bacterium]